MSYDDMQKQAFLEEAYELLGELEAAILELEAAPDDRDLVNRIFRAMHTIKGSGAMFGFDEIADFTHEVETVFEMVRNEELPVTKELLSLILSSRDHIKEMLDKTDSDQGVDEERGNAILRDLQALASTGGAPGEDRTEEVPDEEPEEEGEEEDFEETAEKDDESGIHFYRVRITPPEKGASRSDNLQSVFSELQKLGKSRVIVHTGSIPTLGSLDTDCYGVVWDVLLKTEVDKTGIEDIFFFAEEDLTVTVDALDDEALLDKEEKRLGEILVERGDVTPEDIERALSRQKPLGAILTEEGVAEKSKVEAALAEQEARREIREKTKPKKPKPEKPPVGAAASKPKEAASSIRVAAEKLDYLVDLVGELVIVQAQISQVVGEKSDPQLTVLAEELERLSDELRDSTLGIRMLPIGTTFSKFRRLVRDLCDELGKEIELSTRGAETELDKTVIERLNDPLIHLIRNSIDHGVEPPAERREKGKPEAGTILLTAEHSGGEVLIQIVDDGRGLDPAKLKAKAIERGTISPETDLTEKECFNLIFNAGFSTSEKVTSVSGRGVGMDVVKRSIDALRGSIDIFSQPGKGTTITIKLPLTLAIIEGLQVKVGDEFYVAPLSLVEECVELTRQDVEEAGGQKIINLRGEIVSYIRLRDWFQVPGEAPEIEQIVITGVEGQRVGLAVDNVIGEHQTVIKSLGKVYRDVEGISGATIKGDGSMALILDVPKLVRAVIQTQS